MAFDTPPSRLESAFIQRDTTNSYYEQINISGSDLVIYHDKDGILTADKIQDWVIKYGIGAGGSSLSASWASSSLTSSYIPYNGNRQIQRSGYSGINVGGTNLTQFIENFFFPFNTATISINGTTTYFETGSIQSIGINGAITANSETLFNTGSVKSSTYEVNTFPYASTYSVIDSNVSSSHVYQAYISASNNGSPGIISSTTKNVNFIYPYLWGMSATPGLSGNSLYTTLTRQVQSYGNKTISMVGNGVYVYFCYPSTYPLLTSILDQNLFQLFTSFEYSASVSIISSGLSSNWIANYNVYRSKLIADPNGNYQFIY
jgi:hypothetical protein